ncbi:MAG TPA: aromatic ring-hydroxylating dioxygenase subunit alpha [Actinomycetota bacterium]
MDTEERIATTDGPATPLVHPGLPGRDYHDPAVWELERERIFHRLWFCVGRAERLVEAGDYLVRGVAGESVFVVRTKAGELRAFYNVCRHRGSMLCDAPAGTMKSVVKCPYHAWSYTFDGELVGTPNVGADEGLDRSQYGLWSVALDTWDGFVFVNLLPDPPPLMESLAAEPEEPLQFARYGLGELRVGRRITYEVEANWKIVLDNFNECLHCPTVHPELVQLVPIFRQGAVEAYEGEQGNSLVGEATSFTPSGFSSLPPLPGITEEDRHLYYGFTIMPNLILNLMSDSVMTYTMFPTGPNHTTIESEYLFRPETIADPAFDPSEVVDFWDLVSRQDWVVCERAQRGVRSRAFTRGVYPHNDRILWEFSKRYQAVRGPMPDESE